LAEACGQAIRRGRRQSSLAAPAQRAMMQSTSFLDRTACAGGILRRGQKKSAARIGNTRKLFDEPTTQKAPAQRVAFWRPPAASRRSNDVPASPFAPLLAFAAPERNAGCFYLGRTCSRHFTHCDSPIPSVRLNIGESRMPEYGPHAIHDGIKSIE
jgi:hypothetical protein